MLLACFQLILLQLAAAVLNYGLPERTVEAHVALGTLEHLGDSADDDAAHRHLLLEVKVALVGEFIQAHAGGAVVAHLHEAASLREVAHEACKKGVLGQAQFGAELKQFVTHVALGLQGLVRSLEVSSCTLRD